MDFSAIHYICPQFVLQTFHNHTLVYSSIQKFFVEIMQLHGLCIFSQCKKDGKYIPPVDYWNVLGIVGVTLLLIVLRFLNDKYLFGYLTVKLDVKKKYRDRMPETAWKFFMSLNIWLFSALLLLLKYPYLNTDTVWIGFETPSSKDANSPEPVKNSKCGPSKDQGPTFRDRVNFQVPSSPKWELEMDVPLDIRILYIVFISYYAHSLFALYFTDRDRDLDYLDVFPRTRICMLHHVATLAASYLVLVIPYVRVGVVVIFLTQICEVQLELAKLFLYLKDRREKLPGESRLCGFAARALYITLGFSWIYFKLHLFVTKVLYATFPLVMSLKSGWLVSLYFPYAAVLNFVLVFIWASSWFWFVYVLGYLMSLARKADHKKEETDYEYELFSRFSSFHGWYTFENEDEQYFGATES